MTHTATEKMSHPHFNLTMSVKTYICDLQSNYMYTRQVKLAH